MVVRHLDPTDPSTFLNSGVGEGEQTRFLHAISLPHTSQTRKTFENLQPGRGSQDCTPGDQSFQAGEVKLLENRGMAQHSNLPWVKDGVGNAVLLESSQQGAVGIVGQAEHAKTLHGREGEGLEAGEVEKPIAAEECVSDELVEPVVGGALRPKHLEGETLVGVLDHPRPSIPRRIRETQCGCVPIPCVAGTSSNSLLVGQKLLHPCSTTSTSLLHPNHDHLGDATPVLHLQSLLKVESVAHEQLCVHFLQLLLQPVRGNQAVDGKRSRTALPGGKAEQPKVGVV